ncbi:hypothetical protein ACFQ2K_03725 [Streptomyces sanglieri]|uniref:Uncharacterized protein n=1 Tax=Streptomyces sanglieri TaxID=193460 RepID=A0ABW2WKT8_9ACTN
MHNDRVGLPSDGVGLAPIPAETEQPAKRRAFLGGFAPAFYDAANTHTVDGKEVANAVLENAVGLMLCYDELWFRDRTYCPADMQNLDFVKFVSDDTQLEERAREARAEGRRVVRRHIPLPDSKAELSMTRQHLALHHHITQRMHDAGHSTALQTYRHWRTPHHDDPLIFSLMPGSVVHASRVELMGEWWVADALDLGPMDCIVNSSAADLLCPGSPSEEDSEHLQFETHKVAAIEQVLHLRSTDRLTPRGAYDEYVVDLRKDKRLRALRSFLAGRPSLDGSAAALAKEVNQLITTYQEEALRRMHRPALLRTLASMALGAAGNKVLPGLGGVLSAMVNADRVVSDFGFRKDSRWAMFVVDARRGSSTSSGA